MLLYPDSSAWVKRYIRENGSEETLNWFDEAEEFVCCRIGFVETYRALVLAEPAEPDVPRTEFERDWLRASIVEVDDILVRRAAVLAASLRVRSLDSLHLAAAETLLGRDFALATWDRRMWQAARALGIPLLPEQTP